MNLFHVFSPQLKHPISCICFGGMSGSCWLVNRLATDAGHKETPTKPMWRSVTKGRIIDWKIPRLFPGRSAVSVGIHPRKTMWTQS